MYNVKLSTIIILSFSELSLVVVVSLSLVTSLIVKAKHHTYSIESFITVLPACKLIWERRGKVDIIITRNIQLIQLINLFKYSLIVSVY